MKKSRMRVFVEELVLLLCAGVALIPVYYFVISAFKKRTNIVKFPCR